MEFKSEFSKIDILEDKLKSETTSIFKTNRTINTISYDRIKDLNIWSLNNTKYFFFAIGIVCVIWGFDRGPKYSYYDMDEFYLFDYSKEQILKGLFWGAVCIVTGILFNKKYGKYKVLSVKVFEGKNKSIDIFTTDQVEVLTKVEEEIKKQIFK